MADGEIDAAAQRCTVMARARTLSTWVGTGKRLTAKGVIRRADVAPAAVALGLPDPGWVRTAADVEAIHRPWVAAEAAGLLRLELDSAVAVPPGERDWAEPWLRGLRGVLRAESHDDTRTGATVMCRLVLRLLEGSATPYDLEDAVDRMLAGGAYTEAAAAYQAFRRGVTPAAAAFDLLVEFGAVDASMRTVTPIGRWSQHRLGEPATTPSPPGPNDGADHIYQLKIGLTRFRPPVWRRVLEPADNSLGRLHQIIQVVLSWDDDHLHFFTADRRRYADPFHGLEWCVDEDAATLAAVLPRPGTSIAYCYDLGDCWDHTITLEKVLARGGALSYPHCVGGRGDAPVEDWISDSSELAAIPFDQDELNRELAALSASEPGSAQP